MGDSLGGVFGGDPGWAVGVTLWVGWRCRSGHAEPEGGLLSWRFRRGRAGAGRLSSSLAGEKKKDDTRYLFGQQSSLTQAAGRARGDSNRKKE